MSKYLKYGVSLIPLMIGVSAANAQMPKEREGRQNQAQTERQEERSGKQERNVRRGERGGEERRGDARGERKERMSQEERSGKQERKVRRGERGGEERRGEARSERKERMSKSGDREMRRDGEKRRSDQDRRSKGERSAQDRSERRDRSDRADERRDDRRDGERAGRRDGGKSKSARAKMTNEKRTIIRERVIRRAPKRYSRNEINFNLSVGTAIPRSFVIYDVPSVFFDIYPEYRDYDYIVVGDLLLIIDPDTREIIDVIEV